MRITSQGYLFQKTKKLLIIVLDDLSKTTHKEHHVWISITVKKHLVKS